MSRQKERSFEHWKREEIDQSIRRKEKRRQKLEVLQQELLGAEVLADAVREDRARSSGNDEPISPHHKHFSELERQQRTASLSLRAARKSFKMRKTGTRLESAVGIKAVFSPARTPKTAKAHDEGSGHRESEFESARSAVGATATSYSRRRLFFLCSSSVRLSA